MQAYRKDTEYLISVDRTASLDQSYQEIAAGRYRLPPEAKMAAGGDFFAHLKASTRVLDVTGKEPVYRWESRNLSEHFLHAFNLDRLASKYWRPEDLLPEGDPSFGELDYLQELKGWDGGFLI